MTHEELLAKIELTLGTYISKYYGSKKDVELRSNVIDALQALRAIVELHKPEIASFDLGPQYLACSHCIESTNDHDYHVDYPCPTIQAIEKALG